MWERRPAGPAADRRSPGPAMQIGDWVRLARPHQYIKNAFVLIGPLFGGLWSLELARQSALTVLAFCLAASATYIANDLVDAKADRQHPVKCRRPIAARKIAPLPAGLASLVLALCAMAIAFMVSHTAALILGAYLILQAVYNIRAKHVVLVDVFAISAGFMLRILMGTSGLGIAPSSWLLLCGLMITLFLGFAKRRSEIGLVQDPSIPTRRVLTHYTPALLDQCITICATATILAYSLYTVAPDTIARHGTGGLVATVPIVIFGMMRYLYLLNTQAFGNDAARDVFKDRQLLLTASIWSLTVIVILARSFW